MLALTVGWILSASTTAWAKNGRNDSLTPSRVWKSRLARSRSRAILVTSTSTTVVSWADTCSDSTMRWAMTRRRRVIFSVVPRLAAALAPGWLDGRPATPPARGGGRRRGAGSGLRRLGCACWALAASSTSCLRIRPPTPVPVTAARSTPCSPASLRTSGVT